MKVRPAVLGDIDTIADLLSELRRTSVSSNEIRQSLEIVLNDTDRAVLLAVGEDDQPLGMVVLNLVHHLPEHEVRLDEVVVAEAARGQGCGTALIKAAESWAREHNADVIAFTSRPSRESANRLYQKLGYHIYDTNVYKKAREDFSD